MDIKWILDKWAEYTQYDNNQNRFNLSRYEINKINKLMSIMLDKYDGSGKLAAIVAKSKFMEIMKATQLSVIDVLTQSSLLENEKELYNAFNDDCITDAENEFSLYMSKVVEAVTDKKLIGDSGLAVLSVVSRICQVVEAINECNIDVYVEGGNVENITHFGKMVYIFPTLANCLLELEHVRDGMYICYIDNNGSADGYFGYYIKSNGTILSINERIDESYNGEHKRSRNGRWTDSKKCDVFPYDIMFKFSGHNYKGYATRYSLNETLDTGNGVKLADLGQDNYLPLILGMVMASKLATKIEYGKHIKYVDTLLQVNIEKLKDKGKNELTIVETSSLIESHSKVNLEFDIGKLISGEYNNEFDRNKAVGKRFDEVGDFTDYNKLFVDLWSDGFELDSKKLYETNLLLAIKDKDYNECDIEFIGNENRMRLQGYMKAREELAKFIRSKIYEEFKRTGGVEGIENWYSDNVSRVKNILYKLAVLKYYEIESGKARAVKSGAFSNDKDIHYDIDIIEGENNGYWRAINLAEKAHDGKYIDKINKRKCNMWVVFKPKDYLGLEELLGCEVPKILKGWESRGHFGVGNDLLHNTDAVSRIGTPFEYYESRRNKHGEYKDLDFTVAVGFSKSGMRKAIKEQGLN